MNPKEFGINIALKGGNYVQYFVFEEKLEHHTRGILNIIQRARAGDHSIGWNVTSEEEGKGYIICLVMGIDIEGFGVFLKDDRTPMMGGPGRDFEDPDVKEFFKLQMESLKLNIELQRRHLKTLDAGETWRDS